MYSAKISSLIGEFITLHHTSNPKVALFEGMASILKVMRGDKYDIVYAKFGLLRRKARPVVVYHNHARRQLLLLKKGYMTRICGIAVLKRIPVEHPTNKEIKYVRNWNLLAYDFNVSEVPTAYDIKKLSKQGELEETEELHTDNGDFYQQLIDDMLNARKHIKGEIEDED